MEVSSTETPWPLLSNLFPGYQTSKHVNIITSLEGTHEESFSQKQTCLWYTFVLNKDYSRWTVLLVWSKHFTL